MAGPGRTTTYTEAVGKEICNRALTRSLRSVCLDEDMPPESTVYGWLISEPTFAEDYARARQARAYRRYESVDEITEAMKAGDIKADVGRVLIDAIKWQTSKEAPKVFGDKMELAGNAESPLTVVVRKLSDA